MPSPGAEPVAAAGGAEAAGGSARERRLARLRDARLYLCTPRRADEGDFLPAVLGGPQTPAVDLIQLREKGLEWRDEIAALRRMLAAAQPAGAMVSANDRADLAAFAGVDILHVGQQDIPPRLARQIVGPDVLIGQSTHDPDQFLAALADPDVDYVCVGPVWATPTKPGRPPVGLALPRLAAQHAPPFAPGAKPWFVTGGVDADTLDAVLETGARRVVVLRGITQAAAPAAAARALAARLRAA